MVDYREKVDEAEHILKNHGCRIQTFLAKGQTQYVVKYGMKNVSLSFSSLSGLIDWVNNNTADLIHNIQNED